jgi:hypothetical protein
VAVTIDREEPRHAAIRGLYLEAMPHFVRHAPAMCGRELGGASPRIYWMRRGCAGCGVVGRFAGICPNCGPRVTYSPQAGDAQPAPRVGRFGHSAIRR